jgi:hypothetical protein
MIIGINGYAGSGKDTIGTIVQFLNCYNIGDVTLEDISKDYKAHEWWLEDQSTWAIKKWAGKLKSIATMLTGIPQEKFEDQEFKKTYLGPEWDYWSIKLKEGKTKITEQARVITEEQADANLLFNPVIHGSYRKTWEKEKCRMTVRQFLQELGTDACRNGLHPNTWVNALMADYKPTQVQWSDGPIGGYEDGPLPNWIITDTRFPNEAQAIKDAGGIVIRVDRPGVKAINAHPSETGLDDWNFDHKIMNGSDMVSLMFTVHTILKKHNLYADHQTKNQDVNHP